MKRKTKLAGKWKLGAARAAAAAVMTMAPAAHAADGTWTNPATGGLWSTTGNWAGGIIADGVDSTADFGTIDITAETTVQLDSTRMLGRLVFGDADSGTAAGWVLDNHGAADNVLVLGGPRAITVNALGPQQNATIRAAIVSDGPLTKDGAGELCLAGDVNVGHLAQDLLVEAGTLTVGSPGGNGINARAITIHGGGTLKSEGVNGIADGTVITVNDGGTLDVTDADDTIGRIEGSGTIFGARLRLSSGRGDFSGTKDLAINITRGMTQNFTGAYRGTGELRIDNGTAGVVNTAGFGTIHLGANSDTGTLQYLGAGETSENVLILDGTTGGAILDQSGTGPWTLSWGVRMDGAGDKSITLQGDTEGTGEISGPIHSRQDVAGLLGVRKQGSGTWILSGENRYEGPTTIADGVLLVNGSTHASSVVTADLGTLGGNGLISGPVHISAGATLTAGDGVSPGVLELGNGLAFVSGATYLVRVTGADGSQAGRVIVTGGAVTLDGAKLAIDDTGLTGRPASRPLVIINNKSGGAINGTFAGLAEGARITGPGGSNWYVSYSGGEGRDVTLSPQPGR
jgi:fibronectin-binding autotransporter adhesin